MVELAPAAREALASFKRDLVAAFGDRARRVALFGSVARGEDRWDSDVDVLALLDRAEWRDARAVIDLAADEMPARGVLISPTVMAEAKYAERERHERLLPREIARDGIPL